MTLQQTVFNARCHNQSKLRKKTEFDLILRFDKQVKILCIYKIS